MGLTAMIAEAGIDEGGFRAWDDMAVEAEVAELLFAFVRVLKPLVVVESGTGKGYASKAIAQALADNGVGVLHTFEPLSHIRSAAHARLAGLPVEFHDGYACDHWAGHADLVFVDSWGEQRPREIAYWLPRQVRMIVHDAKEHAALLPVHGGVSFATPRGLWVRL